MTGTVDTDLRRIAEDLLTALRDEDVPPAILDLAARLQTALEDRAAEDQPLSAANT